MQPTVSVIIACYNKEKYLGELLDSVIDQSWRNIQLILVNDGSTDSTGIVISNYKPKLYERGIEPIIIEQDNKGVSIAVCNGLERATGKFVCMPDADDVLSFDYVESMAKCLIDNEEIKWVVCDSDRTRWTQCIDEYTDKICNVSKFENLLERYILMCNHGMVWQLMICTDYLHEVGVLECLRLLGWTTTHEAPVWIPIITGGGQGLYLASKLYRFRDAPASLSNPGRVEKVLGYSRRYKEAVVKVLKFCKVTDKKYYFLAMLREFEEIFIHAPELKEYACRKLSDILIKHGHIGRPIDADAFYIERENPCYGFYYWLWSGFIPQFTLVPEGDVIAFGALGIRATRLLPIWNETRWKPAKLWDKCGSGMFVAKPDFQSLKENDTILVFPINERVLSEVQDDLEKSSALVLYRREMDLLLEKLQIFSFPTWRASSNFDIGAEI